MPVTSRVYLILIKGCDAKQKCHVITKPEIKCRLVNTVPCLRMKKYNLILMRHTFLILFYYKNLFYFLLFHLVCGKRKHPWYKEGEIAWDFRLWSNRSCCKYLESPQILQGLVRSWSTCRPLCEHAAKFPDDDFQLKLPFMFNNTTLRKLIYEQTELDYLYSSLKEGTLTKYCGIFAVFIADLSLTRHFNSLRSKLSYNTHLSSDIDEFSAS